MHVCRKPEGSLVPQFLINTNPMQPMKRGIAHDGAQLPWIGDVLIMDGMINRAQGYKVENNLAMMVATGRGATELVAAERGDAG